MSRGSGASRRCVAQREAFRTARDPDLQHTYATPQIATLPDPDHTSGANNVTGATTRALELLFGDKYDFLVTSLIAGTTPIQYHRFSEMADDVVDVRVYQGIHCRRADVVGRSRTSDPPTGRSHVLKPTS